MALLQLRCPFCEAVTNVNHAGGYAPEYAECASCGERFIYEPLRDGVRTLRPSEADTCTDPERRDEEMGASCED